MEFLLHFHSKIFSIFVLTLIFDSIFFFLWWHSKKQNNERSQCLHLQICLFSHPRCSLFFIFIHRTHFSTTFNFYCDQESLIQTFSPCHKTQTSADSKGANLKGMAISCDCEFVDTVKNHSKVYILVIWVCVLQYWNVNTA